MADEAEQERAGGTQVRVDQQAGDVSGTMIGVKADHVDTMYVEYNAPPAPPPKPVHAIHGPVPDFTGRDADVEALVSLLGHDGATASITGLGGIGKTELALAVAQKLREQYPEQLMFELQPGGTGLAAQEVLSHVIHALEPALKVPDALEDVQQLYRQLLSGQRGLLLLDNTATVDQVRPLLPPPPGWVVIVTSRSRFALPGGRLHQVDLLSPVDAITLLRRMLADGGRDDLQGTDLEPLAERCAYLPLALRLAAGYLVSTGRGLPSYLEDLERARLKYLKDAEGEQSVRVVLGLSVDQLAKRSDDLARRWRDLAVFPAPFDVAAAAAVWELSEEEAQEALDSLCLRSLVDCEGDWYSLHDLLREIALEQQPPDEVYYRHADHYLTHGSAAENLYQAGQVVAGLLAFDAVLPHLKAAFTSMRQHTGPKSQHWLKDFPGYSTYALDLRVSRAEKIQFLGVAIDAARQLGDRRFEEAHLGNLGSAYLDLGRVEQAIEYYQQALAISREIKDRRDEGNWLGNLGNAYGSLGRAEQAIEYHQEALVISREIKDRRGEGSDLGNLGNVYWSLGRAEQAIEYFQQALAIFRGINDRRNEGNELGNLGNAYGDLGRSEQAIEYYQQALVISWEIKDRRAEGAALGNLGNEYADLGRTEQAIEYYQQALTVSREIKDRRVEAIHSWNLGGEFEKAGDVKRAAELMQVLVDYEREIGHPDLVKHEARLADLRLRASKPSGARRRVVEWLSRFGPRKRES